MKRHQLTIGPKNREEEATFAEELFRTRVQRVIYAVMRDKGVTQHDLATRLQVSDARVSQLFGDEANITLRVLARIFHALGEQCEVAVVGASRRSWSRMADMPVGWASPPPVAGEKVQ